MGVFEFFLELFGIETTTDKIMAQTRKTIRRLDRLSKRRTVKAELARKQAEFLKLMADVHQHEADRAARARARQEELLDY